MAEQTKNPPNPPAKDELEDIVQAPTNVEVWACVRMRIHRSIQDVKAYLDQVVADLVKHGQFLSS